MDRKSFRQLAQDLILDFGLAELVIAFRAAFTRAFTASIDIRLQQTSSSNRERAGSSKRGLRRAPRRRDKAVLAGCSF